MIREGDAHNGEVYIVMDGVLTVSQARCLPTLGATLSLCKGCQPSRVALLTAHCPCPVAQAGSALTTVCAGEMFGDVALSLAEPCASTHSYRPDRTGPT